MGRPISDTVYDGDMSDTQALLNVAVDVDIESPSFAGPSPDSQSQSGEPTLDPQRRRNYRLIRHPHSSSHHHAPPPPPGIPSRPLGAARPRRPRGASGAVQMHLMDRRIVMNPPESFIEAAALGSTPPVDEPLVLSPGGQAVMNLPQPASTQSAAASSGTEAGGQGGWEPLGNVVTQQGTPMEVSTDSILQLISSQVSTGGMSSQTPVTAISAAPTMSTAISSDTAASSQSAPSETPGSASATPTESSVGVSRTASRSPSSATPPVTSSVAASVLIVTASTSAPLSSGSASASASISSAAASASASVDNNVPFTHSVGFILLMIFVALVAIGTIATVISFLARRCTLGNQHHDDEDGLSDIVRSFNASKSPSRASSMRSYRSGRLRPEAPAASLQRRSSTFATDPNQSPFLHSGTAFESWRGFEDTGPASTIVRGEGDAPSMMTGIPEHSPALAGPAHLYGMTGPLEVRNAGPSDGGHASAYWTARDGSAPSSPRYLGVDDGGLDTPWGRPIDNPVNPYLVALHAGSGSPAANGAPFPSPPVSINEQPTRASTWASNLRQTLFHAITGKGTPEVYQDDLEDDRYTRTVLPLHRNSTRKRDISTPRPLSYAQADSPYGGFEEIDEKAEESHGWQQASMRSAMDREPSDMSMRV